MRERDSISTLFSEHCVVRPPSGAVQSLFGCFRPRSKVPRVPLGAFLSLAERGGASPSEASNCFQRLSHSDQGLDFASFGVAIEEVTRKGSFSLSHKGGAESVTSSSESGRGSAAAVTAIVVTQKYGPEWFQQYQLQHSSELASMSEKMSVLSSSIAGLESRLCALERKAPHNCSTVVPRPSRFLHDVERRLTALENQARPDGGQELSSESFSGPLISDSLIMYNPTPQELRPSEDRHRMPRGSSTPMARLVMMNRFKGRPEDASVIAGLNSQVRTTSHDPDHDDEDEPIVFI